MGGGKLAFHFSLNSLTMPWHPDCMQHMPSTSLDDALLSHSHESDPCYAAQTHTELFFSPLSSHTDGRTLACAHEQRLLDFRLCRRPYKHAARVLKPSRACADPPRTPRGESGLPTSLHPRASKPSKTTRPLRASRAQGCRSCSRTPPTAASARARPRSRRCGHSRNRPSPPGKPTGGRHARRVPPRYEPPWSGSGPDIPQTLIRGRRADHRGDAAVSRRAAVSGNMCPVALCCLRARGGQVTPQTYSPQQR